MTKQIEKSRVQEITQLHDEIGGYLKMSLEKAIRIGELLTEQKASLEHGEFAGWISENMPFTDRTARNYMRVYRERDRLKTEIVSDLKSAYALLESPLQVIHKEKKTEATAERIQAQRKHVEYARTHQEEIEKEIPKGTVNKGRLPCGWDCESIITGYMAGLPFVKTIVTDPEYLELEPNEAPRELRMLMGQVANKLNNIRAQYRDLFNALQKLMDCGAYFKDAYKLSYEEGVKKLYPEIEANYKEVEKARAKFEKLWQEVQALEPPEGIGIHWAEFAIEMMRDRYGN